MRSVLWTFVGVLGLAGAASAEVEFKTVPDTEWCNGQDSGSWRAQHCEVREATLPASGATITVDAQPNGGIEVVGWDRPEIRLRVKVVGSGDTEAEARSRAAAVRIETDGVIRADGAGAHAWASFKLEVPRDSALALTSKNGGLHLSDLTGTVDARTTNGGVHMARMAGKVTARTTNGGVHVELAGHEWDGEQLDVETSNGGVHLQIPADYNARLQTSTVNGGVHAPPSLRKLFDGKRLDTALGHGGALVRVLTHNGGLRLNEG